MPDSFPARRSPGRLAVSWGLIRAGVYLAFHRKVTLPGYGTAGLPLPVPVKAIGHDERLAELETLARAMGVQIARINGTMMATRKFGPVHLRAHVSDADYTRQFPRIAVRKGDAGATTESRVAA